MLIDLQESSPLRHIQRRLTLQFDQLFVQYMSLNIFESTKHWSYSANDQAAEVEFTELINNCRASLSKDFFDKNAPNFLNTMKKTHLYEVLKTLPKGVLHNVFFDCCEDRNFYQDIIANHPNVYLTEDFVSFRVGSVEEAERHGWVSMAAARNMYKNQEDFIDALMSITTFTGDAFDEAKKKKDSWNQFQKKMANTDTLIYCRDIFRKYAEHVLKKFINNGYQRVEFRSILPKLKDYDEKGNFLGKMPEKAFSEQFERVAKKIEEQNPDFSVGFIFCIRKSLSQQQIVEKIQKICELNWSRSIGIDFIQQEDLYGSISKYDAILERVMSQYPSIRLWKCYHAGQTKNHMSTNIEEAVMAGSVRVGHGLNILQRVEFLPFCKHICFQKCPISNLLLGYTGDPRESSAPILLGLGYAVSINIGDAGKLGAQDSTSDFFVSAVSYDWTLKHFKLIIQHSINHCLVKERHRRQIIKKFNEKWDAWISKFLNRGQRQCKQCPKRLDIFTSTNNWQYSEKDQIAEKIFESMRKKQIDNLPENFFGKLTLTHLKHIRSGELYDILKDMPKGVVHHLHFDCTEDEEFYKEHIITDPNIYLDKERKHFMIGTSQEATQKEWVSFAHLAEEFPDRRKLIKYVANLTMLSKQELERVSGKQHDFWVIFQQKISNFFPLIFTLHIFKKYVKHVLLKYIKSGYDRIEFRALLCQLTEYDENGTFVKVHDESMYMQAFDEAYFEVRKTHPNFTAGFIFFGLKVDSEQVNFNRLDKACSYEWERTIGIDFVQQEDPYGSMQPYIRVGDAIVKKYAHLNLKKVYHAGETKDHTNSNVELSVRSGCVRIGHGLNIVKRIEYLKHCKHVCFELNPISNLLTGGMSDIRMSTAPLLLGLGYAVSISPDDPGKFGYEDTTVDLYASAVSFNWTLKHFKLIGYHSINHAIVSEGQRIKLLESFNRRWSDWVDRLIQRQKEQRIEWPKRPSQNNIDQELNYRRKMPVIVSRINSLQQIE